MRKPKKYRTAIHEAGHAVIGRVLSLSCGHATIIPDSDSAGHSAGHAITHDPYKCLHEWEIRGHCRWDDNAVWRARVITWMAGVEACARSPAQRHRPVTRI